MSRVARVLAVAGCGLALTACAQWMPSLDFTSNILAPANTSASLEVQSDPAGAEARSSTGPSCRTPCALTVPTSGEFAVSFALNGYLPQTIAVRPLPPENREWGAPPVIRFEPSPVFAALQPTAPPPRNKKPANKRPKNTASRPANTPAPNPQ